MQRPCTNSLRRLLVAQDSRELYLVVAEYDFAYKNYLRGNSPNAEDKPSFMTMTQLGPWVTNDKAHMRQIGEILLAFTLKQR